MINHRKQVERRFVVVGSRRRPRIETGLEDLDGGRHEGVARGAYVEGELASVMVA